jgi:hypothetical protein
MVEEGLARYGDDEPRAVPEGGEPLVGFDLTTHQGLFMGNGHNRDSHELLHQLAEQIAT